MTSVRLIPELRSVSVTTLSRPVGSTKLGQPEPESNFAPEWNSSSPQPPQT